MTLGIVGDNSVADRIRETAEDAGETVAHRPASDLLAENPETVVAVGESALLAVVREEVRAPVLPVAVGDGFGGVPEESAVRGVERLLAGEFDTTARTLLDVSVGDERVGPALADVTLVTTEPARISEYAVQSRGERVSRFRADGVVVSTPTGSHGYGRSAGGPLLEPATGVVAVVPVAPFAVDVDHWVLSTDDPVTLTVERDEGEVSLLLDDRAERTVRPHTPVEVTAGDPLTLVRVAESRPFFER
ncbi:ATP-NAD kinase [Halorussus lipolyticus]|uniref:ATP-NAD kinase n=1 Tax=Halorussus lipolyticus TaxID=3034024 RepID=UPI0023E87F08|nr:ATP-NAD kinase [Halorussus sp. DT80]